jgi:hypothetical protein
VVVAVDVLMVLHMEENQVVQVVVLDRDQVHLVDLLFNLVKIQVDQIILIMEMLVEVIQYLAVVGQLLVEVVLTQLVQAHLPHIQAVEMEELAYNYQSVVLQHSTLVVEQVVSIII